MKRIAVLLSGSGVYDGTEIHEAVFSLLSIEKAGASYQCFAPDKQQLHVINHVSGEPVEETRNVLIESARIARGNIKPLTDLKASDYDALLIPGGFGAAKNLNQWAVKGPDGELDPEVRRVILEFNRTGKPLGGLCMGPTVLAQALGNDPSVELTVGTTKEKSPYDIAAISQGMQSIGARPVEKTIREIAVDRQNKVVTAPC
jgi:enhancing lycopene biosynthesis protein 2